VQSECSEDSTSSIPAHPSRVVSLQFGDFTSIYSLPSYRARYKSVITSYFLDTATTVYEYLAVLRHVLSPGGLWLNVGPLQWHFGSNVFLTADELRAVIEGCGFEVLEWEIGEGESYLDAGGGGSNTSLKMEGYRALRFVAKKGSGAEAKEGGDGSTSLVQTLKIGRRAVEDMKLQSADDKKGGEKVADELEIDVID
jgi:hypothetical protein